MDFSQIGSVQELFKAGGVVLILLMCLSIYSLSLMIERFLRYRKTINKSRKLMAFIRKTITTDGLGPKIFDACRVKGYSNTPASRLVLNLLKSEKTNLAEINEVANTIIDWEAAQLSRKLSALATLASTTPFIGLFGTVLGVMRAFSDLSLASGAGASVVAKGISDALINTAAGLFVAVPALIAYNYFLSKVNFFTKDMEYLAQELISVKFQEAKQPSRTVKKQIYEVIK